MLKVKYCVDCNKTIDFSEFCIINATLSTEKAKDLWNNALISIYCPKCYFNRPEKPFKHRKRYLNYYRTFNCQNK